MLGEEEPAAASAELLTAGRRSACSPGFALYEVNKPRKHEWLMHQTLNLGNRVRYPGGVRALKIARSRSSWPI